MVSKSTKESHLLLNILNKISSLKLKDIKKDYYVEHSIYVNNTL